MTTPSTNTLAARPTPYRGVLGLGALVCAIIAGSFVLGSNRASATLSAAAGPSSVAVLDLADLLEGLEERVFLEAELNSEIDKRQTELNLIVDSIKNMQADIELIPMDDKSGRRIQKVRDLRIKEVEARALRQFVQEQLSVEKGQMLAKLYKKIQIAANKIVERDGWDIILIDDSGMELPEMANEQQMLQLILQRRVVGVGSRVDITGDVKTWMNNDFNAARP